jgi:hypothetical protein
MRVESKLKTILAAVIVAGVIAGCGGTNTQQQQAEQAHVEQGVAVAEGDNPNAWAPSAESIAEAKKQDAAPAIALTDSGGADQAIGEMEKLPPSAPPTKLANGDEADQYGLPAWEQMARGDLHVKRIQY